MKKNLPLLGDGSEGRTQFFIVLGFILLPIIGMIVAFYFVVLEDSDPTTGQRLKVPQEVLQNLDTNNQ